MRLLKSKQVIAETPYSFQERFQNIQRIAIVYPQQVAWLRIARYTLQRMYNLPERFEYMLLVPDSSEELAVNVQHHYFNMNYDPNADERMRIQNSIVAFNPDILLQLEPVPNDRLMKLIKQLNISLKIGFGDEKSDLNVIYSQSESGFYEKNILNLIALLEMK
ncbi:MAG: hypothetical protein HOD43_05605 [Candidatus Marinimicrobia bacterium]|jgi:hypothetical protein|nr:hypothetical protein [Candidatus Neomarinimicrobiota bacterium]MBT3632544.1 hypothetical protein [Candidatus Neomarinimicrobiota bacterium]MBT3824943.1 hypothetical protein [Candidatus Neomarinimicrobiota bacterium]MBT4132812.1 hypothetical protein [Candidatus Neomarinimicrobiota bacterium]MBT4295266.1 hypothetical protein [Candidatus Neomarinimicrobiota bacterium]